jgi:hypothetical protein
MLISMKDKRKKRRTNLGGGAKGVPGRKPSAYPIQRLTVQATDDELKLIKERLGTRQRAELLLAHAKEPLTRLARRSRQMTLFYDNDVRHHNPNKDNRRRGRFKKGWDDFVNGKHIDPDVLNDRLTYENLGYRTAATHNAAFASDANGELVNRAYELAVDLQKENLVCRGGKSPGNRPAVGV